MEHASPSHLGFDAGRLEQVTRVANRYVDDGLVAGVVTGVARRGKLAYLAAAGRRDLEHDSRMRTDALFRIYSMTKPITTAALMLLVERSLVRLTDPLSRFVPEFREMQVYVGGTEPPFRTEPAQREIQVWDLLTHTAGLGYGIGDEHPVEKEIERILFNALANDPDLTLEEMARILAGIPLVHHPGTAWRYSLACDLMGTIVEVVTGRPYADFLADELLHPLNMRETWFTIPAREYDRVAQVYTPGEHGLVPSPDSPIMSFWKPRRHPNGGGGLVSSASDYLKFAEMLRNHGRGATGQVLAPRTVRRMMHDHLPPGIAGWNRPGLGFGFGGDVVTDTTQLREHGSLGRFSWGGAANTLFWVDPLEELSVVIMLQRMPGFQIEITGDIATAVYQAIVE